MHNVGLFVTYLTTEFHVLSSSGSVVMATKQETSHVICYSRNSILWKDLHTLLPPSPQNVSVTCSL
jgi:hypothetical protein